MFAKSYLSIFIYFYHLIKILTLSGPNNSFYTSFFTSLNLSIKKLYGICTYLVSSISFSSYSILFIINLISSSSDYFNSLIKNYFYLYYNKTI